MLSGFRNILMIITIGKDKMIKPIEHQTDQPGNERKPRCAGHNLGPDIVTFKICNDVARPCQHSKKHKNEIKDRVYINNCKQLGIIVIFIENTPGYLYQII